MNFLPQATAPVARFLGLGWVAGAALILQISLTRVFSLLIWYHFAFLAVALALLGFTSGGLLVQANPRLASSAMARARLSLYFAVAIPAMLALLAALPLGSSVLESPTQFGLFLLMLLALLVPFTLAGIVVAGSLASLRDAIGRAYFADLLGSGLGCGLSVVAMDALGGGLGGLLIASGAATLGALCFSLEAPGSKPLRGRAFTFLGLLGLGIFLTCSLSRGPLFLPNAKLYPRIPQEFILQRECTSVACVDFFVNPLHFGLWGISERYKGPKPEQIGIVIDAWAITSILKGETDERGRLIPQHPVFEALPPSLVYQHLRGIGRTPGETLVIGAGGGLDVRTALHFGASHVDAVEINPSIIRATTTTFDRFAGGVYRDPSVRLVHAEGRHFLRRQRKLYDVIQVSGVDTFAASQAGAFALSENYLYTTEALQEFLSHLTDDGTLSFTRWLYTPPRQTLRLCAIIEEAIRTLGLGDAARNVTVVAAPVHDADIDFSVVLVKRRPFTEAEVRSLRGAVENNGFHVLYAPYGPVEDTPFKHFFEARDRRAYIDAYPFQIEPSTDDRPFFFEHARFSRLLENRDSIFGAASGQLVLVATLILVLAAAVPFLGAPTLLARRGTPTPPMALHWQAYFLLLGLAYLGVELVFIPRFILFLGNPSYALSVVLLSLLVCSGLGAAISPRILSQGPRSIALATATLTLLLLLYLPLLPRVFHGTFALSFSARVALSVALVAPPAILMGIPFPAAIAYHQKQGEAWVARAWALNGYASLVASVGAVLVAMISGFSSVQIVAALAYGIIAILWLREASRGGAPAESTRCPLRDPQYLVGLKAKPPARVLKAVTNCGTGVLLTPWIIERLKKKMAKI